MCVCDTHLADAASLTEGAHSTHVALVARAEWWRMKGGRVERDTWVMPHFSCGLQMVAVAEQGQGAGTDMFACFFKPHIKDLWNTVYQINFLICIYGHSVCHVVQFMIENICPT